MYQNLAVYSHPKFSHHFFCFFSDSRWNHCGFLCLISSDFQQSRKFTVPSYDKLIYHTTGTISYNIPCTSQAYLASVYTTSNKYHTLYNIPYYIQPYQTTSHHTIPNHDKQGKITPHHTQFPFKCSSYLTLIILDTNNGEYIQNIHRIQIISLQFKKIDLLL